ncbi:MAG: hypothetical protein PUC18_12925 [Prevotellaceae bacterium]|nr:hypothetical protein [Prevotellaceae bacterium]
MKANELMIDDWVYNSHNRQNEQVAEIGSGLVMLAYNDLYEYDEIEPIPLTAEILEQNGFYRERNIGYVYEGGEYEVIVDLWNNSYRILHNRDVMMNIQCFSNVFVHELQHALRHCDVDKEITIKED